MATQVLAENVCPFCGKILSGKYVLNRHYGSCKKLGDMIAASPDRVPADIALVRKKQQQNREKKQQQQKARKENEIIALIYIPCSRCGVSLITRELIMSHVCEEKRSE